MQADNITFDHKENAVPSTNSSRVLQICNLGLSLFGGTVTEVVKQTFV